MTKLANLHAMLSTVHLNSNGAASPSQTHTIPLGVTLMTKVLSLTAAIVLFVPVAAVFLMAAARMIA